jgi:hypothetical protein
VLNLKKQSQFAKRQMGVNPCATKEYEETHVFGGLKNKAKQTKRRPLAGSPK